MCESKISKLSEKTIILEKYTIELKNIAENKGNICRKSRELNIDFPKSILNTDKNQATLRLSHQ